MTVKKTINKRTLFVKTIEILQPKLSLGDWKITVQFTKKRNDILAECLARPEYKTVKIRLNGAYVKEMSPHDIISTALHEMLHCIVWPLAEWAEDLSQKDSNKLKVSNRLEESVVTNLEKILVPFVITSLKKELRSLGYVDSDLQFTEFEVDNKIQK